MCEKCPYPEFFWSLFSLIRTEYVERYSIQMRENTDQKNSEYGHFLRSDGSYCKIWLTGGWIHREIKRIKLPEKFTWKRRCLSKNTLSQNFFAEKLFGSFAANSWRSLSNNIPLVPFLVNFKIVNLMTFKDFLSFIILFNTKRIWINKLCKFCATSISLIEQLETFAFIKKGRMSL